MKTMKRSVLPIPLLMAFSLSFLPLISSGAQGGQEEPAIDEAPLWQNPAQVRVEDREMAFSNESFSNPKNDFVFFMSRFNDGWVLMASLFRTKNPLFDRWGAYAVVSDPEGHSHWATIEMNGRDITFDTKRLALSDGTNSIKNSDEGGNRIYQIHCDFGGFACNLVFENLLPPWKPGDGIEYLSGDRKAFQRQVVCSPWAVVTGSLSLEGKRIAVRGQGFMEKGLFVNPINKLDPKVTSIRLFSTDETDLENRWFIELHESEKHPSYGSGRISRLLVAHGKDWVLTSREFSFEASDFTGIPEVPYTYPRIVRLGCESNGYRLDGEYVVATLFNFTDVLSELPEKIQQVLRIFIQRPVYFRSLGEFRGRLITPNGITHELHLFGPSEYVIVE